MTGPEVTAAMRAEDVDAALVEKAMWAVAGEQPACAECGENGPAACVYCKDDAEKYARHALAAVLPEVRAQAQQGLITDLLTRDICTVRYVLNDYPIQAVPKSALLERRNRIARLTATTGEPTDG